MHSMLHWYGNQLCVMDTETSGLDAHWHEILQIAILPLDSNIKPRKDVLPFVLDLKPDFIERIDPGAIKVNQVDLNNLILKGFDKEKAKDLLREWILKLDLAIRKSGDSCKITPLGHNYAFDRDFIIRWLGIEMYNELFDYHYKDTMITANFMNDRAAVHGERVPYSRVSLGSLAKKHSVSHENKHTSLGDCLATAEVYRQMLSAGMFAGI